MTNPCAKDGEDDDVVGEILLQYLARKERGERVDRERWLAGHAEFADVLRPMIEGFDFCEGLFRPALTRWTDPHVDHPNEPPKSLGDFVLEKELGRGGMATVYRARSPRLGTVALKVFSVTAEFFPSDVMRQYQEFSLASSLEHPRVVKVFESGVVDGRAFIAMELLEGGSLDDQNHGFWDSQTNRGDATASASERRAHRRRMIEILVEVARVVHFLHQSNVTHRDLTPRNILFGADGRFRITDFGLSTRIDGRVRLTELGTQVGTPAYMAPEQVTGVPGQARNPVDIYALGVILYEVLTGRRPFDGETREEIFEKSLRDEPIAPTAIDPTIDPSLEAICLRCLRKRPEDRWSSAAEFADHLESWRLGKRRPLANWAMSPWGWVKANWNRLLWIVVMGLVGGAGFIAAVAGGSDPLRSTYRDQVENLAVVGEPWITLPDPVPIWVSVSMMVVGVILLGGMGLWSVVLVRRSGYWSARPAVASGFDRDEGRRDVFTGLATGSVAGLVMFFGAFGGIYVVRFAIAPAVEDVASQSWWRESSATGNSPLEVSEEIQEQFLHVVARLIRSLPVAIGAGVFASLLTGMWIGGIEAMHASTFLRRGERGLLLGLHYAEATAPVLLFGWAIGRDAVFELNGFGDGTVMTPWNEPGSAVFLFVLCAIVVWLHRDAAPWWWRLPVYTAYFTIPLMDSTLAIVAVVVLCSIHALAMKRRQAATAIGSA